MRIALPGVRLFAAALVSTFVLAPAAAAQSAPTPIGGAKLGSKGIVYDVASGTPPPAVTAEGWLIADLDSGEVLAARNPHGKFLPASTIKTLTAIALLPELDPKKLVKPSNAAANIDGTKVGIKPGHPISIDLLFTGMLIYSGNDTASALADAAGGEAATVRLMNQHAKRLQLGDTHAANPSGLDATGQFSSPYDLALMSRAALKIPEYRRYTAIKKAMVPSPTGSFEIGNKNRLLYNYTGTFGGKTGGTNKALQTYMGYVQRGTTRLVVTIMKTRHWRTEAPKLLDWGFAAAGRVTPVGELVPPLDEVAASASASASAAAGTSAPQAAAKAATTAAASSASSASTEASATPKRPATQRRSFIDRLPEFRWWYAAVPAALAAIVAIAVAWWRRRRRRRGFYMPQTKLRLPVR